MTRATIISAGAGAAVLLAAASKFTLAPLTAARPLVLGGALGLLALHDAQEHRIPNRIVLPAAAVCAALSLAERVHPSAGLYLGATLVAVLLAVSITAPAALGMGDVKLALLILCTLDAFAVVALAFTFEVYAMVALSCCPGTDARR